MTAIEYGMPNSTSNTDGKHFAFIHWKLVKQPTRVGCLYVCSNCRKIEIHRLKPTMDTCCLKCCLPCHTAIPTQILVSLVSNKVNRFQIKKYGAVLCEVCDLHNGNLIYTKVYT